jgi:hypothetical protein
MITDSAGFCLVCGDPTEPGAAEFHPVCLAIVAPDAWYHSLCERCWGVRLTGAPADRLNVRVPEICCFCGGVHRSGIYLREDPAAAPCQGKYERHREDR